MPTALTMARRIAVGDDVKRLVMIGTEREFELLKLRLPNGRRARSGSNDCVFLTAGFAMSMSLKVLDKAKVRKIDQADLFRVSVTTLRRYRRQQSIPREPDILQNLEDFLCCYKVLKVLYVRRYPSIYIWLTAPNQALRPNPIQYMKRFGIHAVREYHQQMLADQAGVSHTSCEPA